jgi:hypothetical protein
VAHRVSQPVLIGGSLHQTRRPRNAQVANELSLQSVNRNPPVVRGTRQSHDMFTQDL